MSDDIDVDVTVSGVSDDDIWLDVIDLYAEAIETFVRKNLNYGNSFENSAKLESIMRYGEVREDELFDIISRQILVRGFYDKISRFHQLQIQGEDDLVGEEVEDTLLDLGNYAIMLAAMRRKYGDTSETTTVEIPTPKDGTWSEEEVEEFMDQFDDSEADFEPGGTVTNEQIEAFRDDE